jgi:hypothetical protein
MSWYVTIPPAPASDFVDSLESALAGATDQILQAGAENQAEAVAVVAAQLVADHLSDDADNPVVVGSIGGHVHSEGNAGPSISISLSTRSAVKT